MAEQGNAYYDFLKKDLHDKKENLKRLKKQVAQHNKMGFESVTNENFTSNDFQGFTNNLISNELIVNGLEKQIETMELNMVMYESLVIKKG